MSKTDIEFGKPYNDLVPIKYATPLPNKYSKWYSDWVECKCICGNVCKVPIKGLVTGKIKSCGCRRIKNGKINHQRLKKNGHILTYQGQTKNLKQWSIETGIPYHKLRKFYNSGKSVEEIFSNKGEANG